MRRAGITPDKSAYPAMPAVQISTVDFSPLRSLDRSSRSVLVWACDRIARSTRHFLEVLDELNRIEVEFVSFREQIDTGGPLGRAIVIIIGAVAELERNLIIERVRAGMRRARLEGQRIGRAPPRTGQRRYPTRP